VRVRRAGLEEREHTIWTSFMLGYGMDSIDKNGKLNTETPEAIAAAEMYQKLVRDYGPIGVRGSTGMSARPCTCRARPPSGSTHRPWAR
jgi:ABC-type glycerol-3-phosphate transport system substrate-binding protein